MPRTGAGGLIGGGRPALEIRPDSPFVVFYGEPSESPSADLTGKLVLNLPEDMSIKGIKLTLTGSRRIAWPLNDRMAPQPLTSRCRFLHETKNFYPSGSSSYKISHGNHEFPFKFTLPGRTDESVEGLGTNWIVYDLNATVDRGLMSRSLTATSHIRVIRTLSRDLSASVPTEQINEEIWREKLAYKITLPQKNYIVGTKITADFILVPLKKGVEISTIKMEVVESRQVSCDYDGHRVHNDFNLVVAQKEGTMPEDSVRWVRNSAEEAAEFCDQVHRFNMTINLPKSLKECRQSVETDNLRITHKLRIYVNIKNPEGHTSQLLVKNHLYLFISPNLPPNPDQSVVVDQALINSAAVDDELNQKAPPAYDEHQLDELYSDIDPSGFVTPGGALTPGGDPLSFANTGANTPLLGHSRSSSAMDLATLNLLAEQGGGGASASVLHTRLQTLSMDQRSRAAVYADARHRSSGGSTPGGAAEDVHPPPSGYAEPPSSIAHNMAALARTPSYDTAVRRDPARTFQSPDLPTYETATSRPSSPARSPRASPTQSLDTLTEETQRNTAINAGRASPRSDPRTSDEGR